MAQAIYEKRQFTDRVTGNIVNYDVYGIKSEVEGEYMELNLSKSLSAAEKIAWRIIATGSDTSNSTVESRKVTPEEEKTFLDQNKKTILDDDDEEDTGLFN